MATYKLTRANYEQKPKFEMKQSHLYLDFTIE